ncbi:MAG: FadR/GntR family transcriptional regulator [Nannocystales bacterium]
MSDVFEGVLDAAERAPLSLTIARRLQRAIVSGELADGAALPSEKELCARLSVGRSTVREALRILQAQGLVTGGDRVSTRGPKVRRDGALPIAATALGTAVALERLPRADLVELRLLIEEDAVRRAAHGGQTEALHRARAAAQVMVDTDEPEAFLQADVAFHTALIDAADNRAYALVMTVVREAMATHLRDALAASPTVSSVLPALAQEHLELLDAIESGDAQLAADRVRAHIADFYEGTDAT